jgi:hypothetical protein
VSGGEGVCCGQFDKVEVIAVPSSEESGKRPHLRSLIALNWRSIAASLDGGVRRVLFFDRFQSFPHDVMTPPWLTSVIEFEQETIGVVESSRQRDDWPECGYRFFSGHDITPFVHCYRHRLLLPGIVSRVTAPIDPPRAGISHLPRLPASITHATISQQNCS